MNFVSASFATTERQMTEMSQQKKKQVFGLNFSFKLHLHCRRFLHLWPKSNSREKLQKNYTDTFLLSATQNFRNLELTCWARSANCLFSSQIVFVSAQCTLTVCSVGLRDHTTFMAATIVTNSFAYLISAEFTLYYYNQQEHLKQVEPGYFVPTNGLKVQTILQLCLELTKAERHLRCHFSWFAAKFSRIFSLFAVKFSI